MKNTPSTLLIILAFISLYIIWGSTYFFIQVAVQHVPPMLIGGIRFILAGVIILTFIGFKGERIWNPQVLLNAFVSGTLMLFLGTGSVIWVEQYLSSSFVAIFIASSPIWFLVLDKPNWLINFQNKFTVLGVVIGIIGVFFLFYEDLMLNHSQKSIIPFIILLIGNLGWVYGSLYSKYKTSNVPASLNSAWQMISAGTVFFTMSIINKSMFTLDWTSVPLNAWLSILYLVIFGSIIAYSAYVFLLAHRNPTQVSSYAYVNPLVAVLLGVFFNNEKLTYIQGLGLIIILCGVIFINVAKKKLMKKNYKMNVSVK